MLKQGLITALTNSEVGADIPIPIGRVIIAIERERACITAIIRVTADMKNTPFLVEYLVTNPLIIFNSLESEAGAESPNPTGRAKIAKERERARSTAKSRATADKKNTPTTVGKVKITCPFS